MATTYENNAPDRLRELFVVGVTNAHAVEKQALSIMEPQVARIENYPEMAERLRAHIEETHGQVARLDEILAELDTKSSFLKDTGLSMTGGMAAMAHTVAGDEILKNSFANFAFEHFEIATYKSLLTLAEDSAFAKFTPHLQTSLREEEGFAAWIGDALPMITRRYAQLYVAEGAYAAKV